MANHFDRILKENIEPLIPFMVKRLLGLEVTLTEHMKDKLQTTLEREADYLIWSLENGAPLILHLEFQTAHDPRMAKRMLLYHAMLINKYDHPIRQYVIYLGKKQRVETPVSISSYRLEYSYELISLWQLDAGLFLASNQPEEVILAILADFRDKEPEEIIQAILSRLKELTASQPGFEKYEIQLRVLSQLRKLQLQTNNVIKNMAMRVSIKKDPLYKEGFESGIEKGELNKARVFVIYLLQNTNYENVKIADIAGVQVAFVAGIRNELSGK